MTGGDGGAGPDRRPRVRLGAAAVLGALVAALLGVLSAGESEPGAADARVRTVLEGAGPSWRNVALATDVLGEPVGAALLVGAAVTGCLLLRSPRAAVLVVAATGAAVGATKVAKPLVGRTIHDGHLAYPSGHTAFLTAFVLALALIAAGRRGRGGPAGTAHVRPPARRPGAPLGWAQVVLGSHYPTDTIGGWCTALAVTPPTAWFLNRPHASRQNPVPTTPTPNDR